MTVARIIPASLEKYNLLNVGAINYSDDWGIILLGQNTGLLNEVVKI